MDELHKRATARKAEIVIPKRSRGRQSVAARLACQAGRRALLPKRGNPGEGGNSPPHDVAMTAPSSVVSAAISVVLVAEPMHDRAWWIEESARAGTGWAGVIDAALNIMVAAGITEQLAARTSGP